jgi:hypothetical protein
MVIGCWDGKAFEEGELCEKRLLNRKGLDTPVRPVAFQAKTLIPLSAKSLSFASMVGRSAEPEGNDPCSKMGIQQTKPKKQNQLDRRVNIQSVKNKTYRKLVAKALKVKRVKLRRLMRVDLDGDGVEEVLFEATYDAKPSAYRVERYTMLMGDDEHAPKTSAWEVVGYRKVIGKGKVVTKVVTRSEVPLGAQYATKLEGLSDLNGDGILEVVVNDRGDHSVFQSIWLLGAKPIRLAGGGCGW